MNRRRFEKGTRFYSLSIAQDLLGDWVVVRVFGRIGSRLGQVRTDAFESEALARGYFEAECERRVKRGYAPASTLKM